MIFESLGEDELALIEDMIIHKPLRNFLLLNQEIFINILVVDKSINER